MSQMQPTDELLPAKILAQRLHIGQSTLWRMVKTGMLPPSDLKLGNRCTRWSWQQVREFLEERNGKGE